MPRTHTTADYHRLWTISSLNSDGDGENFAVSISRTTHEKKQPTEAAVMVCSSVDGKVLSKFKEDKARNFSPALNHDGTRVAFLQKTSDSNFLVISDFREAITSKVKLDGVPEKLQWAGDSILLLMQDPVDTKLASRREEGIDGTFFEEEDQFTSLYRFYPGRGLKKLTENLQVWEFSENSGQVALIASQGPQERFWYRNKLYGMKLDGGKPKLLYDPDWRSLAMPRVSPDGTMVLFTESLRSDRGLNAGDLIEYDLKSGKARNITEGSDRSFMNSVWTETGFSTIWFKEGNFGISEYSGSWTEIWSAEGTALPAFASQLAFKDDAYLIGFTDRTSLPEVYAVTAKSGHKAITNFNSRLTDLESYPAEVVKWKSTDGTEIYGILRSLGPDSPLVVDVHGGPTAASTISFFDRGTILLSNGFSVFYPNYRGSTGKGRNYAEANRGDMGGKDFQDIMTGIQYLKDSGKVKTDNLFITGGSYGGFMTSWAVTQTDIFKAAVGLFGITDWVSFHGATNISDWDQTHYDDDPYTGKLYRKFSPMEYINKVRTPVLLMHGAQDPCVPVGQYHQFYRGLKDLGKTVRFLVFPREGHGFSERNHVEQYAEETLKWFRKYMD